MCHASVVDKVRLKSRCQKAPLLSHVWLFHAGCCLPERLHVEKSWACSQGLIRHFRGEMEDRIGRASLAAEQIAA